MNKVAMVEDVEVMGGLNNMDFYSLRLVSARYAKPTLSPKYVTIPLGDRPVTWWQIDHIEPVPSWEGQPFVLMKRYLVLTLVMDLPLQQLMLLPKPPSVDLQNVISATTIIVFHTILLLTK